MKLKDLNTLFNVDKLIKSIEVAEKELRANTELYMRCGDDIAEYVVLTFVSSHAGIHASREFIQMFYDEYENELFDEPSDDDIMDTYIDAIDECLNQVNAGVNDMLLKNGYKPNNTWLYIGFNETDGAIDLFVGMNVEDEDE